MDHCKYHPIEPATYFCNNCDTHTCDSCTDIDPQGEKTLCFMCRREVENLGSANSAEPFWRRMKESFHYPLSSQPLIIIICIPILLAVVGYFPLGFILQIALSCVFLKYCFSCLQSTADGKMKAPDIQEAYSGGFSLLLKVIAIFIAITFGAIGIANVFGFLVAGLVLTVLIFGLPAIFINLGITDSLAEALNPLSMMRIITGVGLPYGLLLAIILVMSASVGVINQLLAQNDSAISLLLQSMVSNYYTIVAFHIMGYMIFQYQHKFGFSVRADHGDDVIYRTDEQRLMAKVGVLTKEGDYESAEKTFSKAVKQFPNDKAILVACFDYLMAIKSLESLQAFAETYFIFLARTQNLSQLNLEYKRLLQVVPSFVPKDPSVRYAVAKACHERGDSQSTVKLLNGMHKDAPDFPDLVDAYELMAEAMEDVPKLKPRVSKCRELITHLKKLQQLRQA